MNEPISLMCLEQTISEEGTNLGVNVATPNRISECVY